MEVAIRKKRPLSSAGGAGGSGGAASSSWASSSATGLGASYDPAGLSSGTRRSYGAGSARAASALSMYADPPQEEVTLDQFERAGIDRLTALKAMESIRIKKGAALSNKNAVGTNDPTESPFSSVLSKYNLDNPAWDNLSHFVLRLAYCRSEELRRWLISQEALLFKYRFDSEKEEVLSAFLRENQLNYAPLDEEELNSEVAPINEEEAERGPTVYLRDVLRSVPYADPHQSVYFKVPFEDAIDLLRERKVYLQAGWAYVSRANLSAIITTKFRARLSQALGQTCRAISQTKQDARVQPLLTLLSKQYITPTYKSSKIEGAVTKEQLPTLAERSMPLCMSTLYGALKAENHLRHGGRMQLGLFLKGIGLSLSEALAFWKASFARKTPPEKFDKEYAYNIRHNYGKEGKRSDYTPYGCVKIIQSTPGPGDHHGCPFRQWDEAHLRAKMKAKLFTDSQREEVLALVKGSHFQIACQRWWQFTHGNQVADASGVGNHPNAYFDASEQWWRAQEAGIAAQQQQQQQAAGAGAQQQPRPGVAPGAAAASGYNAFPSATPSSAAPSTSSAPAAAPSALPLNGASPAAAPSAAASSPPAAVAAPASSDLAPMEISQPDSPAPPADAAQA